MFKLQRIRTLLLGFFTITMFMVSAPVFAQEIAVENLLDALVAQEEESGPREPAPLEPCEIETAEMEYYCQRDGRESVECINAQTRESICFAGLHCSPEQWMQIREILQNELDQCLAAAGGSELERARCHLDITNRTLQTCHDERRQPGAISALERRICEAEGADEYDACIEAYCPRRSTRSCQQYCSAIEQGTVARCLYLDFPQTPEQAACERALRLCMASVSDLSGAARCTSIYNACITPPLI